MTSILVLVVSKRSKDYKVTDFSSDLSLHWLNCSSSLIYRAQDDQWTLL